MREARRYSNNFPGSVFFTNLRKSVIELIQEPLRWFKVYKDKTEENKYIYGLMDKVD